MGPSLTGVSHCEEGTIVGEGEGDIGLLSVDAIAGNEGLEEGREDGREEGLEHELSLDSNSASPRT